MSIYIEIYLYGMMSENCGVSRNIRIPRAERNLKILVPFSKCKQLKFVSLASGARYLNIQWPNEMQNAQKIGKLVEKSVRV